MRKILITDDIRRMANEYVEKLFLTEMENLLSQ